MPRAGVNRICQIFCESHQVRLEYTALPHPIGPDRPDQARLGATAIIRPSQTDAARSGLLLPCAFKILWHQKDIAVDFVDITPSAQRHRGVQFLVNHF